MAQHTYRTTSSAHRLRLAEVLGALSHALDLTEGQPEGHCVRCCWIGVQVGAELGLSRQEMSDLYYTLLLKDLGCSSNAARICSLYVTDDLVFKREFKRVDGSLPAAIRFVLQHTGMKAPMAERFRAILRVLRDGGELARELIQTRCERGAGIARRMRFSEAVAQGIRDLDEHHDGGGYPSGLAGEAIHPFARIALLAQVADVIATAAGAEAARQEVAARAGTWFDPSVAEAFARVSSRPGFFETLAGPDLQEQVFALEPGDEVRVLGEDYLDDITDAFAEVVDAKSPFTSGHSRRVAIYSDLIAEDLALDGGHRRWIKRAALLHDIGKLGVSNSVLDKPGRPSETEWAELRRHATLTEHILSRITAFRDMAETAAAHHERLDGNGYPKRLRGEEIAFESRILAVADVFDALTADRPYRAAMPIPKAMELMRTDVGTALDGQCFMALERGIASLIGS